MLAQKTRDLGVCWAYLAKAPDRRGGR